MPRRPKGYAGINHETIGSDILSVLRTLSLPEQILGAETAQALSSINPEGWYPIAMMLDLMERLHKAVGPYGMRKMGRTLFRMSHEETARRMCTSARDIVFAFDRLYNNANRGGSIGGWKVLKFEPGRVELEKTTPHLCLMEEGLLEAALAAMGTPSIVEQTACFRNGAEACVFVATSTITDARWNGAAEARR